MQRLQTQVRCGEPVPVGPEHECCEQRICVRQRTAAGVGTHQGTSGGEPDRIWIKWYLSSWEKMKQCSFL